MEIAATAKASMKLIVNNLYWKGNDTETINFSQIYLENEGMKPISNISAEIFLPAEWEYEISPKKIEQLNPSARLPIDIKIKTPKSVLPGIYQIKFKMVGNNVNRILQTSEIEFKAGLLKNKYNGDRFVSGNQSCSDYCDYMVYYQNLKELILLSKGG